MVSKVLSQFVDAIIKVAPNYTYMPENSEDRESVKSSFFKMAGFPGVLGCIDGTHIPLIAPTEDEYSYVNRRKFHSINVQAVCDANAIFLDVVARFPGQHHDSYILRASHLHDRFEEKEFGDCWLLGDSGYPLKSWLMTPIGSPNGTLERRYNRSHKKTRCIIERAFGILKSRFRILDHTGGTLCYKPDKVCKIIMTCCVLHNICRRNGTPLIDDAEEPEIISDDTTESATNISGERQRQRLVALIQE